MRRFLFALIILTSFTAQAATTDRLAALEKKIGGRLGVVAIETGTNRRLEYRAGERFLMCSTFKLALAAHILQRVDARKEKLDRVISYGPADLLEYAPVTSKHVSEKGLSIEALAKAAVEVSDNTAANLLLKTQGGPAGLTAFFKSLGDSTSRLDRTEPSLNSPIAGKDLDTTTPAAGAETVRKLVLGKSLSEKSRARLEEWLLANTTGAARLKAGLPPRWRIADKTGTGDEGATNDVGVLYPPNGAPIVIAVYLAESKKPRAELETAISEVARLTVEDLTTKTANP